MRFLPQTVGMLKAMLCVCCRSCFRKEGKIPATVTDTSDFIQPKIFKTYELTLSPFQKYWYSKMISWFFFYTMKNMLVLNQKINLRQ